jgi:hypothetical protein
MVHGLYFIIDLTEKVTDLTAWIIEMIWSRLFESDLQCHDWLENDSNLRCVSVPGKFSNTVCFCVFFFFEFFIFFKKIIFYILLDCIYIKNN